MMQLDVTINRPKYKSKFLNKLLYKPLLDLYGDYKQTKKKTIFRYMYFARLPDWVADIRNLESYENFIHTEHREKYRV